MKVQFKQSLCDGFGTCAKHAPELFVLDEWGYASLSGDGRVAAEPAAEDRARRAIIDCPVHAIVEIPDQEERQE